MEENKSKGNMYEFIDETRNPLAGKCMHGCSYCYVEKSKKRYKSHMKKYSGPPRISKNGIKQINGKDKKIFVVTMNDLFAENVPDIVISKILERCNKYNNDYLFQTKNPKRLLNYLQFFGNTNMFNQVTPHIIKGSTVVTTLETDKFIPQIMNNSPKPIERAAYFSMINEKMFNKCITIEPIIDFDMSRFIQMIKECRPDQVNLGADSGGNKLPEPSKDKILELISELEKFTKVHQKKNLKRLIR
jgi:DNA repair photolyase